MSKFKTFLSINNDTYLLLLSFSDKNLAKIFIPSVFKVLPDSIPIIVFTHSFRTAFPVFLVDDILVATYLKNFIYNNYYYFIY